MTHSTGALGPWFRAWLETSLPTPLITTATVDADYGLFINNATEGTFDTVGGIMLTHELNNFTMQEAINNSIPHLRYGVLLGPRHDLKC